MARRVFLAFIMKEIYGGLLGIYIHNIKDQTGNRDKKGENPFNFWYKTINGEKTYYSLIYSTFDWVNDDGYNNLGKWVEKAAKEAGR